MGPDQEGNWKSIQGHTQRKALRGGEREEDMVSKRDE